MRRELPMILVRVIVGLVFLLEGALKFLHPEEMGVGRFAAMGLPFPHELASIVGGIEIGGGTAIVFNIYAGDAALVLLAVIISAIVTTKAPILLGHPLGPLPLPKLLHYGLLSFLHEAQGDLVMFFGALAVLIDAGVRVGRRRRWYQND